MKSFSERFNVLCDAAGFIEGRGRMTEVARFFDTGVSTARNWLVENKCPRVPTLEKLIKRLKKYRRLSSSIDDKSLLLWLEKGDTYVVNPFEATASEASAQYPLILAMNKYPQLRKALKLHGIDVKNTSTNVEAAEQEIVACVIEELMSRSKVDC